jgi:hypothetical protein
MNKFTYDPIPQDKDCNKLEITKECNGKLTVRIISKSNFGPIVMVNAADILDLAEKIKELSLKLLNSKGQLLIE